MNKKNFLHVHFFYLYNKINTILFESYQFKKYLYLTERRFYLYYYNIYNLLNFHKKIIFCLCDTFYFDIVTKLLNFLFV